MPLSFGELSVKLAQADVTAGSFVLTAHLSKVAKVHARHLKMGTTAVILMPKQLLTVYEYLTSV